MYTININQDNVAFLNLDRPDLHNAFNDELIEKLIAELKNLEKKSVRLLVLTGNGKSFCAGADLNWMKKMKDYSMEENIQDSQKLCELFTVLNHFKAPVIGKINGAALGGGAGLVACCDYALAVDSAVFGFTEVRLGLIPAVISPFVIAKIGESNARAYFLSGQRFSAETALKMGLVHSVVTEDKLDLFLDALIKEFLMAAPFASQHAKELVYQVVRKPTLEAARDYTCERIAVLRKSEEGQEGMSSLLEKRKPLWLK
jgi:methylglutaconyl-CoA hydratase